MYIESLRGSTRGKFMWPKSYRDYPKDKDLKKQKVEPLHGITGCEMHEVNGWGETYHEAPPKKRGLIYFLLKSILGTKGQKGE